VTTQVDKRWNERKLGQEGLYAEIEALASGYYGGIGAGQILWGYRAEPSRGFQVWRPTETPGRRPVKKREERGGIVLKITIYFTIPFFKLFY
jgi:hypothetical protein